MLSTANQQAETIEVLVRIQRWVKLSYSKRGTSLFAPSCAAKEKHQQEDGSGASATTNAKVFGCDQAFNTPLWNARHYTVEAKTGGSADTDELSTGLVTCVMKEQDKDLGDITVTIGEWTAPPSSAGGESSDDPVASASCAIGLGGPDGHLQIAQMLVAAIRRMSSPDVQRLMDFIVRPSFVFPSETGINAVLNMNNAGVELSDEEKLKKQEQHVDPSGVFASGTGGTFGAGHQTESWEDALGLGGDDEGLPLIGNAASLVNTTNHQKMAIKNNGPSVPPYSVGPPPPTFVAKGAVPIAPIFAIGDTSNAVIAEKDKLIAEWEEAIANAKATGKAGGDGRKADPETIKKFIAEAQRNIAVLKDDQQRFGHPEFMKKGEKSGVLHTLREKAGMKVNGKSEQQDLEISLAQRVLSGHLTAKGSLMKHVLNTVSSTVLSLLPPGAVQQPDDDDDDDGGASKNASNLVDADDIAWFAAVYHTRSGTTPQQTGGGDGGSLLGATESFFRNTTHAERTIVTSLALCSDPPTKDEVQLGNKNAASHKPPLSTTSEFCHQFGMRFESAKLAYLDEPHRSRRQVGVVLVFYLHENIRGVVCLPQQQPAVRLRPTHLAGYNTNAYSFAKKFTALCQKAIQEEGANPSQTGGGGAHGGRPATDDVAALRVGDTTTILADGSLLLSAPASGNPTPMDTPRGVNDAGASTFPRYLIHHDHPLMRASRKRAVIDLDVVEKEEALKVGETADGGLFACCSTGEGTTTKSGMERKRQAMEREQARVLRSQREGTWAFKQLPKAIVDTLTRLERVLDTALEVITTFRRHAQPQSLLQVSVSLCSPNPNPLDYTEPFILPELDDDNIPIQRPAPDVKTMLTPDFVNPTALENSSVKFMLEMRRVPQTANAEALHAAAQSVEEYCHQMLHAVQVYDPTTAMADATAKRMEIAAKEIALAEGRKATTTTSGGASANPGNGAAGGPLPLHVSSDDDDSDADYQEDLSVAFDAVKAVNEYQPVNISDGSTIESASVVVPFDATTSSSVGPQQASLGGGGPSLGGGGKRRHGLQQELVLTGDVEVSRKLSSLLPLLPGTHQKPHMTLPLAAAEDDPAYVSAANGTCRTDTTVATAVFAVHEGSGGSAAGGAQRRSRFFGGGLSPNPSGASPSKSKRHHHNSRANDVEDLYDRQQGELDDEDELSSDDFSDLDDAVHAAAVNDGAEDPVSITQYGLSNSTSTASTPYRHRGGRGGGTLDFGIANNTYINGCYTNPTYGEKTDEEHAHRKALLQAVTAVHGPLLVQCVAACRSLEHLTPKNNEMK